MQLGTGPPASTPPGASPTTVSYVHGHNRPNPNIHDRRFADLDTTILYELLRLRTDSFVVEQACAYPELDGRDPEPGTRHVWLNDPEGQPAASLRVLTEIDGSHRIGRVVTRPDSRRKGLATQLLTHIHNTTTGRIVLDAQTYLVPWYASLGYEATGDEFIEDGVAHVPMTRKV